MGCSPLREVVVKALIECHVFHAHLQMTKNKRIKMAAYKTSCSKNKHDKKADMEIVMSYPVTDTKTKKLS